MFTFNQAKNPIYHENNNKFMLQLGEQLSELAVGSMGFGYQEGCTYFPVVSYSGQEPACHTPLIHFDLPAERVVFETNPESSPSVLFRIGGQWFRVKNRQVGNTFCVEFLAHFSALCYELDPVQWEHNASELLIQRIRIGEYRLAKTILYARSNPIDFYRKLTERDRVPLDKMIDDYVRERAYLVVLAVHELASQPTLAVLPGYKTPFPRDFLEGCINEDIVNSYLNTAPVEFCAPKQYRAQLQTNEVFRKWAYGLYIAVNESKYVCDQMQSIYEPLCVKDASQPEPLTQAERDVLCGIYYALREVVSIATPRHDSLDGQDYLWMVLGQPQQTDLDWLLASAHGRFAFRYKNVDVLERDYRLSAEQEEALQELYFAGDWLALSTRYDEFLLAL